MTRQQERNLKFARQGTAVVEPFEGAYIVMTPDGVCQPIAKGYRRHRLTHRKAP